MKKLNPNFLPYVAAIATGVMLMHAAVRYFGVWGWVIGPTVGLVSSFALAVAGSRISDIAAKRKPLAYISLVLMLVLNPVVIALTYLQSTWAVWSWAILPDAAILLASVVTGRSLIVIDPLPKPATTQLAPQASRKKTKVARKSVKEADLIAYLQANRQASQQQVADHFGITRSAIGQRIKKLVAQKKLKI